jgi:hypothetical protein
MSETLKVFKNVHTQNAVGAAHSVTLASTSGTQRAVIKEVNCKGVLAATLDLDGRTVMTSTIAGKDMVASGNLIMDVNSVLSLKFPLLGTPVSKNFKGMMFARGSDGIGMIRGNADHSSGLATTMTSTTRLTSSSTPASSACAAIHPTSGALTFFRMNSGTVYEYIDNATANVVTSYNMGSSSIQGLATDGTYLYGIVEGGTSSVHRRNIATGTNDTFSTSQTVYGQGSNQGCFLEYHKGWLYTQGTGGEGTAYAIRVSDGQVTEITSASMSGSYSDGGTIVTNAAGQPYLLHVGTSQWKWLKLLAAGGPDDTDFTNTSNSSGASTEYGDGGVEVAPGIGFFMCEQSDDLTIIDTNTNPPSWQHISSGTDRNFGTQNDYGDKFAVCGFIQPDVLAVNYDAYCSGVLVTDAS